MLLILAMKTFTISTKNRPMKKTKLLQWIILLCTRMNLKIVSLFLLITISFTLYTQQASFNYAYRTGSLGTDYSWINCSSGTTILSGDDVRGSLNLPFDFTYYDNSYSAGTSISVGSNGFIRFDGLASTNYWSASSYNITSTETSFGQIICVAIYDGKVGDNGGYCKYLVTGTSPNRILTIEFYNYELDYNDNRYASIQVSLYETTNTIVIKNGTDNINKSGVDQGLHSGVVGYYHKWQEVLSGSNNAWIEYTRNKWKGSVSDDWNTAANWTSNQVPASGESIIFDESPLNHLVMDQNRLVNDVVNTQSTYRLVTNGHTLSVAGDLIFSTGAQIDATASSSVVEFNGSSQQSIPVGSFKDDESAGIKINNTFGLNLNQSFTVTESLVLTNGNLIIGANTLSIEGALSVTSGGLTGGSSSNIVYDGSGNTNLPSVLLNNLTINRSGNSISMLGDVEVEGLLTLTAGSLVTGANSLTISGSSPTGTGSVNASATGAHLIFDNSSAITLASTFFGAAVYNMTISGAGGITSNGDFTLNGTLNLNIANPSSTKGALDMLDGTTLKTLTMGANSITIGQGDVSGKVKRTTLNANTIYTFGNQYSTLTLTNGTGTELPDEITFIIKIGSTHSSKSDAVQRHYEIIRSGSNVGSSPTRFNLKLHYLDSELNGCEESNLVFWDHHVTYSGTSPHAHGVSSQNTTDNYMSLASHGIGYLVEHEYDPSQEGTATANYSKIWIIAERVVPAGIFVWTGTDTGDPTNWFVGNNWEDNVAPPSATPANDIIYIPDAEYDPVLPDQATTRVNSIYIFNGGILNSRSDANILQADYIKIFEGGTYNGEDNTIELYGAININNGDVTWNNQGTFNAGTSNVIFKNTDAAISGTTNFYDVEIPATYKVSLVEGAIMRIGNTITNDGTFNAYFLGPSTVEYNKAGNQTVITPEDNQYHHLILSGSGTKTISSSIADILGDFTISGSAETTGTASLDIGGNMLIDNSAEFNTGDFNHEIKGDFTNNSSLVTDADKSITFNGTALQTIGGSVKTTFDNLVVNNAAGVEMDSDVDVDVNLTLTAGNLSVLDNTLGIYGSVSVTSKIETTSQSSLVFGGSSQYTIPDNLFATDPQVNNLTINNSNGVIAGAQPFTVNGNLNLTAGTFDIESKSLILNGGIVLSSGVLLSDNATNLSFGENASSITLPDNLFTTPILNNLSVNRSGGVVLSNQSPYLYGKLILENGIITTNSSGFIVLDKLATVGTTALNTTPGSASSYVNGLVRKFGNTEFTFPVGDANYHAPIGISAANGGGDDTEYFDATYKFTNPSDDSYNTYSKGSGVHHVASTEYWILDRSVGGTNEVKVSLSWDARTGGVDSAEYLVVVRWDGSKWVNHGQTAIESADLEAGTLTSDYISTFSPFTFASSTNDNPLPVELTEFDANCTSYSYVINWQTASESNNDYFLIQKSDDLKTWKDISILSGKGNSSGFTNYLFEDFELSNSVVYYRLKQFDFDGTETNLQTIAAKPCELLESRVDVFPNPTNGTITVSSCSDESVFEIYLYSSNGAIALHQKSESGHDIDISHLKDGIYSYKIIFSNSVSTGKLEILK